MDILARWKELAAPQIWCWSTSLLSAWDDRPFFEAAIARVSKEVVY